MTGHRPHPTLPADRPGPPAAPWIGAWSEGHSAGRAAGYAAGYRAGLADGVDIGGAQTLLGIQHALGPDALAGLLPALPWPGEYQRLRNLRADDGRPCPDRCGRCSSCHRAAAVAENLRLYGSPDYPGRAAELATRTGRGTS